MSLSPDSTAAPRALALPANLDFPSAAPLKEAFLERVGADLTIDASLVQRLGGSALQVLLAAARTWKSDGFALTVERASPRFLEDLKLLGCEPENFLNGAMAP